MKPSKQKRPVPDAIDSERQPPPSTGMRWMRWGVGILVSIHLIVMLSMMANHISRPAIVAGSDAWHMLYFNQFSEGGHCYYPKNDIEHVADAYTPLASEIFGWTIRALGPDIRWVRLVVSLFGLGAVWLAGACVKRLTGDRFFAFVTMGLCAGLEVKWYLDVGPNTVHVFFSILALYLLLRDPALSRKTLVGAGLALFAYQAFVAVWQLELVNYVEHYGLLRQKKPNGKYERTQPKHSWNTNHTFSNMMLFHLQRHSDHHAHPSREYPALRLGDLSEAKRPVLPRSLPAMAALALIPPLWRRVMDKRVAALQGTKTRAQG